MLEVPPEVALIDVVPALLALAKPGTLGAFAIVATLALEELQCTTAVRSCVLPSLNVPVAENCCVPPIFTVLVSGKMLIEVSVPLLTVTVVCPLIAPRLTDTVAEPLFLP